MTSTPAAGVINSHPVGVVEPIPPPSVTSSTRPTPSKKKSQPFWLGGAASMGAACFSHPLDLLKVRLQCSTTAKPPGGVTVPRESLVRIVSNIIRSDGILSLYNGLSASLMRQGTYSTVRFGCYEALKEWRLDQLRSNYARQTHPSGPYPHELPMMEGILIGMLSGSIGGVAGNPADLVNVRMQNDRKLPIDQRRNYRNVFDGLAKISRQDGVLSLWNGVGPNVMRAALMTTGQLVSYDYFKNLLVDHGFDSKNIGTHLTASCLAGVVATVITQPVDVIKTRIMNSAPMPCSTSSLNHTSPPGGAKVSSSQSPTSTLTVMRQMMVHEGPQSFFKGFIPALTRLGPHTIATFIFLEQLKKLT